MCTHTHVPTCMHTYTHTYVHAHTYEHAHTYARTHTHTRTHTYARTHKYIIHARKYAHNRTQHTLTSARTHTNTHIRARTHTCERTHTYACTRACIRMKVQLIGPEGPRIGSLCVYKLCVAPLALLALGLINWVFQTSDWCTVPYGNLDLRVPKVSPRSQLLTKCTSTGLATTKG
jgi:hypothetical protein